MTPVVNPPYEGQGFFEHMVSCRENYRKLGECIWKIVGPVETVLDIGCGVGHIIQLFHEKGAFVYGIDGDEESRKYSKCPDFIKIQDLRTLTTWGIQRDLVMCTETAEHIDEKYEDNVINNVVYCAKHWVLWSAAQPGQDWPGHVNMKPRDRWRKKLERAGLVHIDDMTLQLRTLMWETKAQHCYCRENFMVFAKP